MAEKILVTNASLAAADVVSLHCPLTAETTDLTGAASERVALQSVENAFAILDGRQPDARCLVNPEALERRR